MGLLQIDNEILVEMKGYGSTMTYVIANCLRLHHKYHNGTLKTARVLRRLKALEALGKVERVPSVYSVQICWRLTPNAKVRGPL